LAGKKAGGKMVGTNHNCNFARSIIASLAALVTVVPVGSAQTNSVKAKPAVAATELDAKLFFALGMIESGNDDRGIGRGGEVSRYQIHPSVWKSYSPSTDYRNPEVSARVARHHWNYLTNYFREYAGREPTPFDMYVLWNTRFGHYARKGFDPARLSSIIRDRARRFVNLVNR
jgi:hypothetical protein